MRFSIFDACMVMASVIGMPLGMPLLVAMYIKRLPYGSYFAIFAACMVPSLWSFYDAKYNENPWTYQDRMLWIFIACAVTTVICMPFYKYSTKRYFKMTEEFFEKFKTPIDYEKEVGVSKDYVQLQLMGNTCLIASALLCMLFIGVNELWEVLSVLFMIGFVAGVGLLLRVGANTEKKRVEAKLRGENLDPLDS